MANYLDETGLQEVRNKIDSLYARKDIYGIVMTSGVVACKARWLRFDPSNRKGLIIKAGTYLKQANGTIKEYATDTAIDLTSVISSNGADYGVYLKNDGTVTASLLSGSAPANSVKIGRFHTLCVDAGTMNMTAPAQPSSGIVSGNSFLVKPYREDEDPDFYAFYNKTVSSVTVRTYYDVVTCSHPLSGFTAGDILPESVFCLTFHPDTLYEDGMVYDKNTDRVIDIYLQSGKGNLTKSVYNATHTVSRQQQNHQADMSAVGKRLLMQHEFISGALGSNEKTVIKGASDKTTVGGHTDTSNRRMISAIGCEEMCGYLSQYMLLSIFYGNTEKSGDGHGSFGKILAEQSAVSAAGGRWDYGSKCGSRFLDAFLDVSTTDGREGGRGISNIVRTF